MVNPLGASVLALAEHRIVRTFTGQLAPIVAGVLGVDGSWGATIGEDRALRIWHTADGREFARLGFKVQPKRLVLSPHASPALLAVSDDAAGVWLIDAREARVKWAINLDNGAPSSLSFTLDGRALLLTTARGVEKLDVSTGARLSELPLPDAGPAALSEDGSVLAVVAAGGYAVAVLNPDDGSVLASIAPRGTVTDLALTRDASQLLVGSSSGLFAYDTKSGALLRMLDFNRVNGLALLADGESVLVAAQETSLYRLSDGGKVDSFANFGISLVTSCLAPGRATRE